MYNRYDGNTGRFVRIPEPEPPGAAGSSPPCGTRLRRRSADLHIIRRRSAAGQNTGRRPLGGGGLDSLFPENISGLLGKLVPGALREGLELEDLLLMLILYLMYRESGDKELLIVLGAMLFL